MWALKNCLVVWCHDGVFLHCVVSWWCVSALCGVMMAFLHCVVSWWCISALCGVMMCSCITWCHDGVFPCIVWCHDDVFLHCVVSWWCVSLHSSTLLCFDALSWLTMDHSTQQRRTCLPIHLFILSKLYHLFSTLEQHWLTTPPQPASFHWPILAITVTDFFCNNKSSIFYLRNILVMLLLYSSPFHS